MRTSTSPSLSKSPNAQPRPTFSAVMAGPAFADTSSKRPLPRLRYRIFGSPVGQVQLAVGDLRVDVAVGDEDVLPAVVVEVEEVDAEADVLAIDAQAGPDAASPRTRRRRSGRASSPAPRSSCGRCPASRRRRSRRRRRPCRPAPRRSRRRRSPRARRSRGTCRRGCCDRTGSARCRTRRRCRASRRCRNRPPRRPFRTSPSAASCCSTNTIDEGPRGRAMPGRLRDIGKRAVAAVAIEEVRAAGEPERTARDRRSRCSGSTRESPGRGARRRIEVHVVGDEQIEVAVAVVVEKAAAGAPARRRARDARAFARRR